MEYYISLTYKCNLSCSYCAAQKVVFESRPGENKTISQKTLADIIDYAIKDSRNRAEQSYLVFYGGEPTLEPDLICFAINKSKMSGLKYILYTNGLLLNSLPFSILNNIDIIFVSIDGDESTHDFYKFKGSYKKVLENVKSIRCNSSAKVIARITLQEESNLYNSVTNIYHYFDYIFWQNVNKCSFNNSIKMTNNFTINIKKLYNFWISEIQKDNFVKIIPFIALMDDVSIKNVSTFKCGMGIAQLTFDIYGNAYMCDEYIGHEQHMCGNVNDYSSIKIQQISNHDIFSDCISCNISHICRGRCRHALEVFPKETLRTYCSLTKLLIDTVQQVKINDLLNSEDLEIVKITEQIP